jgi:hypothetical protein
VTRPCPPPDLINVFEVFLPQLLLYPNPTDPLNGEAAALLMRDPALYNIRVKGALLWTGRRRGGVARHARTQELMSWAGHVIIGHGMAEPSPCLRARRSQL